jgi:uncharacterized OB-fold protein
MSDLAKDPYVAAFPETLPFWAAAANGVFMLPRCKRCTKVHWHPRAFCPFCHDTDLEWIAASGRGKVYSYSIVRHPKAPYVLAYVEIEEGLLLMSNIVDCEFDAVHVDMPVQVQMRATAEGRHAPVFGPVR